MKIGNIFRGKRILIMGLGLNNGGLESAKFFCRHGADVLVTDKKTEKELKKTLHKLKNFPVKFFLGGHRKKDFRSVDLIVKNPGVSWESPYLKIAQENNIPVKTGLDIFFDFIPESQVIGITGTKGKSTTASLSYLFLKNKIPVVLAGNIGVSPLSVISKIKKNTKVILELSSFDLERIKKSPHIAVITSIFPDHLDRHKTFNSYLKAKANIFKYQGENDILILNKEDKISKKLSEKAVSKIYFFNPKEIESKYPQSLIKTHPLNIAAAVALAKIFEISEKEIKLTLKKFKGVPNRQELVAVKGGIKYINDTSATNPSAVVWALKKLKKDDPSSNIVLIAGGVDKRLDYKEMAKEIKKSVKSLVLLPGSASKKIKDNLNGFNDIIEVFSMDEAVKQSSKIAKKGDIVILSPGAASFNLFQNEFDRGEKFINKVKEL